jgi:hypothetical protein
MDTFYINQSTAASSHTRSWHLPACASCTGASPSSNIVRGREDEHDATLRHTSYHHVALLVIHDARLVCVDR